jgi:hypothetical protein
MSEERAVMAGLLGTLKACTVCREPFESYWLKSAIFPDIRWPTRCMTCERKFIQVYMAIYFDHYDRELEMALSREREDRSQERPKIQ